MSVILPLGPFLHARDFVRQTIPAPQARRNGTAARGPTRQGGVRAGAAALPHPDSH